MRLKWKAVTAGAVVATVILSLAWFATQRGPLAPVAVETAAARTTELRQSVFGIGTVEARYAYAIGPTQAGRVLKVLVDHGDAVKAGQLLAEMDSVDLGQRLSSAESALQRAEQSVPVAEAQVREAESRRLVADANAARYRDLAQKNFVSREASEARANEANITRAGLEAASAGVLVAHKDVERARQDRNAVAKQLESLRLTSPVDGVVVAREAEPGTTAVAGQTVVRIVDPGSVWVRARVDQARAFGLKPGLTAEIVLRSEPRSVLPARVVRVEIQSDSVADERIVAVGFKQPPPALSLGELAEVTIHRDTVGSGLAVPTAAVKRTSSQYGVWQIVDGKTRFRQVRIGTQTLDGLTQVLDGLMEGERVIVYSGVQLREGVRVRVGKKS